MKWLIFLITLFCTDGLQADPWGKDADLSCKTSTVGGEETCKTLLLGPLGEQLISFHQNVISPADGPRSHYIPSSSQYTKESMRKYGFFLGFFLGCDRLMRENADQWVYKTTFNPAGEVLKWDPVR